jgi:hypothetical protein
MKGEIEEFIDALRIHAQETALTSESPARPEAAHRPALPAESSRDRGSRDDDA